MQTVVRCSHEYVVISVSETSLIGKVKQRYLHNDLQRAGEHEQKDKSLMLWELIFMFLRKTIHFKRYLSEGGDFSKILYFTKTDIGNCLIYGCSYNSVSLPKALAKEN